MLTKVQLNKIHSNLKRELKSDGVSIKQIYVCPHGWNEGCFCRKPNPGMFFQAAAEFQLNLSDSYCIGDDERDMIAGTNAGCKTFLVSEKQSFYEIVKKYL